MSNNPGVSSRGQLSKALFIGGNSSRAATIQGTFHRGQFLESNCSGVNYPGSNCPGCNNPGSDYPVGNFPAAIIQGEFSSGAIVRIPGITCKKVPCYMRSSACRWFIVKKARIFWS